MKPRLPELKIAIFMVVVVVVVVVVVAGGVGAWLVGGRLCGIWSER